jgi:hypothetical protein
MNNKNKLCRFDPRSFVRYGFFRGTELEESNGTVGYW